MTKIPTKTLLSLFVASAAATHTPTLGARSRPRKRDERLERLLVKHDKKGELRAALLNVDPADLPALQKKHPLGELARQKGFADTNSFWRALHAKVRDELHARGWSYGRLQAKIAKKLTPAGRRQDPDYEG